MRFLYVITILITIYSCKESSSEKDALNETNDSINQVDICPSKFDTLFYGMEPISIGESISPIADLRSCFYMVKEDSLIIGVESRSIPDSIEYNNQNIAKGFFEYGIDIVFRNKNNLNAMDNIVFSLSYNNLDNDDKEIKTDFTSFLNACDKKIYQEEEKGEYDIKQNKVIEDLNDVKIKVSNDNYLTFKCHKDLFCNYFEDYFSQGFLVKMCHNIPEVQGENNFITRTVNSDEKIMHSFIFNSARKIK